MLTFVHGYRIYECPFFCRLLACDDDIVIVPQLASLVYELITLLK